MTDLVGTGAALAALGYGAELLRRLLGPSVDEAGELLREYTHLRFARLRDRMEGAGRLIAAAGREPQPVPAKILDPLLHGASLEEEPELATAWEALIANAAIHREDRPIHPRFPDILRQITSMDAAVIKYLSELRNQDPNSRAGLQQVAEALGTEEASLEPVRDTLVSLGLIEEGLSTRLAFGGGYSYAPSGTYRLSSLGVRFLAACTPPAPAAE